MISFKHGAKLSALTLTLMTSFNSTADIQHLDDVIITFSACIGNDCVNGESFGFDTMRIKENNLRIHAQDTSTSASFPTNDWRLVFNDSSNGGGNYFAVEDSDSARQVFRVDAGAPASALYVDAQGDIGVGTSTPVVDIHVKSGNTPTLRLEQDGSSGFGTQTWDLAGNETNFFIRDASNGSTLPFRIRPSAPSDSIFVDTDGDIGMGTSSPDARLHVDTNDGAEPSFLINNEGSGSADLILTATGNLGLGEATPTYNMHITDTLQPRLFFDRDTVTTNNFELGYRSDFDGYGFFDATSGNRFLVFQPDGDFHLNTGSAKVNGSWAMSIDSASAVTFGGDVEVKGTFTNTSSRDTKHKITAVMGDYILDKLSNLDINTWTYITDKSQASHIGPMAEDFYSLFNLGKNNKTISPMDTAGVSLAAVKALMDKVKQQQIEIDTLRELMNNN